MDLDHKAFLDRNYRFQRHIYDLTRECYLLGRTTLIAGLVPPDDGRVLEIGCGTARNLIQIAGRYPGASLYGIDLSEVMLEVANTKLRSARLDDRVRLAHADATDFDAYALFGVASFERIAFSYTLSMIPSWQTALRHAANQLCSNGSLHIVDFGQGTGLPGAANTLLRAWLKRFHVTPRDEMIRVLDDIAGRIGATVYSSDLYNGYASYSVLTRR